MILIKKPNSKTLPGVSAFGFITAALVVALFIVVAAILAFGANDSDSKKPNEDNNNIEDLSQDNKQILGLGDAKEQQKKEAEKKAEEDAKTESYKRYEQLSDEEKSQLDIIPSQYVVNDERSEDENISGLPSKFDLRDIIDIPRKDQAEHGLCWDFASIRSTETNMALRKNEIRDFSEMHVSYMMSTKLIGERDIDTIEGGNFDIFTQYVNYTGLVDEAKVPYKNYDESEYLDFLNMDSDTHVTSIRKFNTENSGTEEQINDIKNHIKEYGSVVVTINAYNVYSPLNNSESWQEGALFCPDFSYECSWTNHAVSIIGWDDNYSKNNFHAAEKNNQKIEPSRDGAWIAMNSWGDSSEIIYISYDDGVVLSDVSGVISTDPEDGIKIDDLFKTDLVKEALADKLRNIGYEYNGEKYVVSVNGGKLYDVTTLDLSNKGITDEMLKDVMDDVAKLPNIGNIDLSYNSITDISLIKDLWQKSHTDVNLEGNQISDLSPLDGVEVFNLYLANNPLKAPIDLSNTKVVTTLDISNSWALENEQTIKLPKNILRIIADNTGISTISQLKPNPESDYPPMFINVRGNYLENLDGIEEFSGMAGIDVSENPIKNYDSLKSMLENAESVSTFTLKAEHTGLSSLEPLDGLNLTSIYIADNEIKNFDNFDCDSVYYLDISNNPGISGFSKCSNLSTLVANSIELEDLNEILLLGKLNTLSLEGNNYIDDYRELDKIDSLIVLSVAGDKTINYLPKGIIHINLKDTGINNQTTFDSLLSLRSINISDNPELTNYENIYNLIKNISEENDLFGFNIAGAENISLEDYEKIKEISENIFFENASIIIPIESNNNPLTLEKGSDLRKIGLKTMLWTYGKSIEGGYFTKDAKELVFTKPEVTFTESAQVTYRIVRN